MDFFTPIVDDPFAFGQIAAANALSDCFTMGAQPVTGLNLVAFPCALGLDALGQILRGGAEKMREARAVILGGHSVDDPEPKYGIAVTGTVDPRKMITNRGARPGDKLILTKKIGTGIVTNLTKAFNPFRKAARRLMGKGGGLKDGVFEEAVASMITLNQKASRLMVEAGARASTDVTGYGLLGHLHNVMEASGARARVRFSRVPRFDDLLPHAIAGTAGGGERNRGWARGFASYRPGVDPNMQALLNDAQTSGGLLIAAGPAEAEALVAEMHKAGVSAAAVIGEVVEGPPGTIEVEL